MSESFGEYIRILRNQHGYTLTQLAAKLGIDSGALSKIETQKKQLDPKILNCLCTVFNLEKNRIKNEYFSEKVAKILFDNQCSEEVLSIAAQKIKLLKTKNIKQRSPSEK